MRRSKVLWPGRRTVLSGLAGTVTGIAGALVAAAIATSVAGGAPAAQRLDPVTLLDGAHVPPLLTVAGERPILRYALVCAGPDGAACDGSGEVYIRAGQSGQFRVIRLQRGDDSNEGRYYAAVPDDIAVSPDGFSYYAVLRDNASGATLTLPTGGSAAPERSLPLGTPVGVHLPSHVFGHVRAGNHVVLAPWGSGAGQAGLSGAPELGYVGPSAFDVSANGEIVVLDQVNKRVERWAAHAGGPSTVELPVSGGIADMRIESDGTIDVLEPHGGRPLLRRFDRAGHLRSTQPIADRTWSQLELEPTGPAVQQEPSEQWMPAARGSDTLGREEQAKAGRPGRRLANGHELVVLRAGTDELRLADVAGNRVRRSWRITSETPLGEVQLAEPLGGRIVVVLKTYTDKRDEFLALVLDASGIAQHFSLAPAQWAESAALARFRLAGTSLYQLGSTPAGAFVDRFDLGGSR
jgi:hypothetical protein